VISDVLLVLSFWVICEYEVDLVLLIIYLNFT
jgi:hypothetical protein